MISLDFNVKCAAIYSLQSFSEFWDVTGVTLQVEDNLVKVRNAGTEQDLGIQYKALKPEVDKLNIMAAKRQQVQLYSCWY